MLPTFRKKAFMFKHGVAFALLGCTIMLPSIPAIASGTGGSGSGSSSYLGPSAPRDPYADAFARGKSQFKKRITCKKCEFPTGVHDKVIAGKVAMRVNAGSFN